MYEDVNVIKEQANENIYSILEVLGVEYKDKYEYLNGKCPIHLGNRKDAWSWHLNRGVWKCFSQGCDEDYGADIFGLVRGIKECDFLQAVRFVKGFVKSSLSKEEVKELRDAKENREFVNQVRMKDKRGRVYPKSALDSLEYHPYLEGRGFSKEIVDKYHIGMGRDKSRYMSDRIVFPILNMDGEIVGFTGRSVHEDWELRNIPKWKHSKDYDANNNLFNINHAKKHIEESGEVIIAEGPIDVLRFEQSGIHNSVAILGKSLHAGQMTLLMQCSAFKLIIALDNDKAGKDGSRRAKDLAKAFFSIESFKIPEHRKDIDEMSAEEIRCAYELS